MSNFQINPKILQAEVEGQQMLILDPDKGEYFELNSTSVLILKLMQEGNDFDSIIKKLLLEFECEESTLVSDLKILIKSFESANILISY